ncbi:class I SAM-dependent methyltransferase [Streptomyces sp. MS1.AVA.3]|uniref:class I SAM-dependent methyltransferase n=1 Tax=Streptomyces decoyicus TaxID=249567 RepID=UPI0030C4CA01
MAGNGGYHYTGIDLSPVQLDANEEQAAAWRESDLLAAQPEWLLGDAADVLPVLEEDAYDYVFTCPPYHNLEKYSDHPADLSAMRWKEFAEAYREIVPPLCAASPRTGSPPGSWAKSATPSA